MRNCPNCQTQIDDQQQFCPNCGMQAEQNEQAPKSKKGKKFAVIAVSAAALIVAITAAVLFFTWYNSDEKQVIRALEAGEYKTVLEIMEENRSLCVNDELEKLLSERLSELKTEYTANNLTYAKLCEELDTIEQMEMKAVSSELTNLREYALALNESRTNFSTAEEFFAKGHYPEAMKYYRLVTDADANYETARAKVTEAQDKYRQKKLDEAATFADNGDYTGAVDVLQDGLTVLPEDSKLTQQITIYEKANADQIKDTAMTTAAGYAESGAYLDAIEVLEDYLKTAPGDADVTKKIGEYQAAYTQKQKDEALAAAAKYAETEDYVSAVAVLQNYLDTIADDADVSRQLKLYQTAHADKIREDALTEASSYASYGDYLSAMNVLKNYIDTYGTHVDVTVANNGYKESYVASIISEGDNSAASGNYVAAIEIIGAAQANVTDVRLNQKRANYETAYVDAVVGESDALLEAGDYTQAKSVINDALELVPSNDALLSQLQKVEKVIPKNFLDECWPYESKNISTYSDGETFSMGAESYGDGIVLKHPHSWSDADCWFISNLRAEYTEIQFYLGHVDGSSMRDKNIEIYLDGVLYGTYEVLCEGMPQLITIPVSGVVQFKVSSPNDAYYLEIGLGKMTIR